MTMPPGRLAVVLLGTLLSAAPAAADSWPSFRGPAARGVADGQDLPVSWSVAKGENVLWKTEIPGLGHSSPVVMGDRIFVTTATAKEIPDLVLGDSGGIDLAEDAVQHTWKIYALDKKTGKILWQRSVVTGKPRAKRHVKASQANATPATDGKTLVALLGSEGLYAFDLDGKPLWQADLGVLDPGLFGDPSSQWGHSSSPVIYEDLVIIQVDRHQDSFLAAHDLATGRQVWKVERDEMPVWATPTVHRGAKRDELIVVGGRHVRAYDPKTGRELWRFADHAEVKTPTPFLADGKIILSGGYRGRPIYALAPGGSGDLSVEPEGNGSGAPEAKEHSGEEPAAEETVGGASDHLLWRTDRGGPYTSTPVAYGKHLYSVTDTGILSVYDLATGERLHRERTEDTYSASLFASDGKIYLTGENGLVTVVKTGTELTTLAKNDMGEPCMATPAISEKALFFRCRSHVYAIGEKKSSKRSPKKSARGR